MLVARCLKRWVQTLGPPRTLLTSSLAFADSETAITPARGKVLCSRHTSPASTHLLALAHSNCHLNHNSGTNIRLFIKNKSNDLLR